MPKRRNLNCASSATPPYWPTVKNSTRFALVSSSTVRPIISG